MIKVKIMNLMGSDALGRWCDRNRDNFYKMLKYQNMFRDYSIEFTDSDDFDYMFVGMSDFINKQIPLQESVERGVENLEKLTQGGDYFLFDGSDSTSLMGAYEVLEQSNAIYLFKNQMLRDRKLYNEPAAFGKWFFGSGSDLDLSYDISEKNWDRIKLSGFNIAFRDMDEYLKFKPINKNKDVDVCAIYQTNMHYCEDHGVRNDDHYSAHRQGCWDALSDKFISKKDKLPFNEYIDTLYNSKVAISPFGMGEVCFREFECMQYGTIVIKPDQSRLITKPDVYVENETYIPCKLDWSDINEKVQYVIDNFDELNEKINNGFRQRFVDGYKPENLCMHWYEIFSNLSNVGVDGE